MGFADLFKSAKDREREKRRALRHEERAAERALSGMTRRIRQIEKLRDQYWAEARKLLQAGQKVEAARMLNKYKLQNAQIANLEKQRLLVQGKLNSVAGASDLGAALKSIERLAVGSEVDPDAVGDSLDGINEVEGDIRDVNETVSNALDEDIERADEIAKEQNAAVGDDELMAALESEAAAEVSGGKVSEPVPEASGDINSGRDRLRALLNEK